MPTSTDDSRHVLLRTPLVSILLLLGGVLLVVSSWVPGDEPVIVAIVVVGALLEAKRGSGVESCRLVPAIVGFRVGEAVGLVVGSGVILSVGTEVGAGVGAGGTTTSVDVVPTEGKTSTPVTKRKHGSSFVRTSGGQLYRISMYRFGVSPLPMSSSSSSQMEQSRHVVRTVGELYIETPQLVGLERSSSVTDTQ